MFKLILIILAFECNFMNVEAEKIDFDVESSSTHKDLALVQNGDLLVVKVRNPKENVLGDVKMGNLVENGGGDYKLRHVLLEDNNGTKKVKIITEYENKRPLIKEYIKKEGEEFKPLKREAIEVNLNHETLPEHVHFLYDDLQEVNKIKVNDPMKELKIGRVTLNDHVIEDLENSLERFVYFWDSDDGRKNIKIDTHLEDNRLLSETFEEDSRGSRNFIKKRDCGGSPFHVLGCRDSLNNL